MCAFTVDQDFALEKFVFGAVKLTTNADPDNHKYSDYVIGFDVSESFSLRDGGGFGKKVIIFGADTSSSLDIDDKKKSIY